MHTKKICSFFSYRHRWTLLTMNLVRFVLYDWNKNSDCLWIIARIFWFSVWWALKKFCATKIIPKKIEYELGVKFWHMFMGLLFYLYLEIVCNLILWKYLLKKNLRAANDHYVLKDVQQKKWFGKSSSLQNKYWLVYWS